MCISVDLLLAGGVSLAATQGNTDDTAGKCNVKAVCVFVYVQRKDSLVVLAVGQAPWKSRNLISASSVPQYLFTYQTWVKHQSLFRGIHNVDLLTPNSMCICIENKKNTEENGSFRAKKPQVK